VQRSRKKEIFKIDDVPLDAIILWSATGSPLEVKAELDRRGFKHFSYLAFIKYSGLDLAEPPFIMDFAEDFRANRAEYAKTYALLADQKSKEIFTKVLNFKISFDYKFMEGFTNDHKGQYFDQEILPAFHNISFVDGGGYVGDSASEVIANYPEFKKIYLIEPIAENLRIAKRDLAAYAEKIEYFECGLGKRSETLSFHEEKSFSTTNATGSQSVTIKTVDEIIQESVDYIKLDIEGAEQDAIEGAKESILNYHPTLALCIYHKAEDWYKIPQKVLAIRDDYTIYLRHYMEGIFESVLYFIPIKP
jgi:FkbM family methyltransferase